ncbi:MAG: hypothetical protein JXA50_04850 [Deltaproteobacteria bacterium]|nr:hypothetical protein [Deltaproteobacteria bacterium]
MKKTLLKKVGIGFSALFLIAALGIGGVGCAYDEELKAQREAAEAAAKRAEDAAAKAEAAAAKCEKAFEQGLRK